MAIKTVSDDLSIEPRDDAIRIRIRAGRLGTDDGYIDVFKEVYFDLREDEAVALVRVLAKEIDWLEVIRWPTSATMRSTRPSAVSSPPGP